MMNSPLVSKLNAVRRRHAALSVGTALIAISVAAVLCLTGGMLLDRSMDLPYAVRAAMLGFYGIALFALLVWRGVLPVVRGPDLEQAALWVERAVPAFGSRLISAVQFMQPAGIGPGSSPSMARAVVRQAEAVAADVDFSVVVPLQSLKRLAIVASSVVLAIAIGFSFGGRTSLALVERALLVPGVPYPHRTFITADDSDAVVARGEPTTLSATASGVVPASGRVIVRYGSGATATFAATAQGATFSRVIENAQEPFSYRFAIGDNESAERHVRVADRPAVLGLRCLVTPPAYTGLRARERSPWDLSVPVGSKLGLVVSTNVPSDGAVHFVGTNEDVPLARSLALLMPEAQIPAAATGFTIALTSIDGLLGRDPVVYRLDQIADRPPTVRLTAPTADATVTPMARPTIAMEADDDYGVARLALRYRVTKAGQTVAVDDDPNGLTGTYGDGVTRVDPDVNFSWGATPPPPGVDPARSFPVRWVGSIRPVTSDSYYFDDRGSVTVMVAGQPGRGPIRMQAGRLYPIVVTTVATPTGEARLNWRGRRTGWSVVPHGCLYRRTDPYEPPPDADGLVGYWPMDDADPGYVRDAVGSADGTVYDVDRAPGKVGNGILFGVHADAGRHNRRVELPEVPAMQFGADDSYTLSAWVQVGPATVQWQAVVVQWRWGGRWSGIGIDQVGRIAAVSAGGDLVGPAPKQGWHHVAVVQDGPAGTRTLYVDGEPAVTGPAREVPGGPMCFGDTPDGKMPFVGGLDEVRLYARAVSADQVRAMANDPNAAHVPTPAEIGGLPGGAAATVPIELPGKPSPHVAQRLAWDLSTLPVRPAVGDTIELWAEARDGNTLSGPGVATSEHRQLKVVDEATKRQELMGRLGDYLGRVKDVSDAQKDLTDKVGTMVRPTPKPGGGR